MSARYQELDAPYFNYEIAPLPGDERIRVRGPVPNLTRDFIVCIGAAQTFGRFCHAPFPTLLTNLLGMPALNLGIGGAGPRTFITPAVLQLLNSARLVTIQVLSGRSASNSQFDNTSQGHGLWGTCLVEGKNMRFEEVLGRVVRQEPAGTLCRIVKETRASYLDGYRALFAAIRAPKILHWFSGRSPDLTDDFASARHFGVGSVLGAFPHLVNRPMVDDLRRHCDAYAETVSSAGLPQRLWKANEPILGVELENGYLVNRYYPTQAMHGRAAKHLLAECNRFIGVTGA